MAQVSRKTFERMRPEYHTDTRETLYAKLRLNEVPHAVLIAVIVLALCAAALGIVLFGRCSAGGSVIVRDAAAPVEEDGADTAQGDPELTDTPVSEDPATVASDDIDLLRVHVSGAVMVPGVYELSEDACVLDAIDAAGGLTGDADLTSVNLAERVYDGCKINIPSVATDETALSDPDVSIDRYESVVEEPTLSAVSSDVSSSSGLVNINTADEEALQALPGIGPALAAAIVEDRTLNGAFFTPEDLMRVSGIGEKKFAKLKDWVVI